MPDGTGTINKYAAKRQHLSYQISARPASPRKRSRGTVSASVSRNRVGLSMMCYTLGKAERTCRGERQARGLIGKLLY